MLGLIWIFLISLADVKIDAKRSVSYDFPGPYCGYQPREVDGIVLRSSHNLMYANSGCVMRFESDDDFFTTKKLMMNFRYFNITDCSVSLKVFYRPDAFGEPDLALNCRSTRPAALYTSGKYLTLRLDKTTNVGYDFEIIITSFKYGPFCKELHCRNDKCIDRDLLCDGVDNCFDNTDEFNCYDHYHRGEGVRGRSKLWMILSSSLVLMAIIVAMCFAGVCVLRRRRYRASQQPQTIRLQQPPLRHQHQQQHQQQQQPLFEYTQPPQPTMPQPPAYSNVVPPYSSVHDASYPTNAPYPASGYAPYPTQYPSQQSTYPGGQPYTGYQGNVS